MANAAVPHVLDVCQCLPHELRRARARCDPGRKKENERMEEGLTSEKQSEEERLRRLFMHMHGRLKADQPHMRMLDNQKLDKSAPTNMKSNSVQVSSMEEVFLRVDQTLSVAIGMNKIGQLENWESMFETAAYNHPKSISNPRAADLENFRKNKTSATW